MGNTPSTILKRFRQTDFVGSDDPPREICIIHGLIALRTYGERASTKYVPIKSAQDKYYTYCHTLLIVSITRS